VAPALINDLVLLLAELMENATGFSPPGTRVVVASFQDIDGVRLAVVDHGIGMANDRIIEENSRLTRRERLDLAPTEVLGLFVVGRLARRHGLSVALTETPGSGVTATVHLPVRLLVDPAMASPQPLRRNGQRPSVSTAVGASRRELDLLGRASEVVRGVRPWNAFATGVRPVAVAAVRAPAPFPHQRAESLPSSTLHRRVPGASLRELEGEAPARPAPLAPPASPADVRDSLADFESGVARAMREFRDARGAESHSPSHQGEQP
jgi:hypothetical protein